MTRPRRAFESEPENADPAVAYVPRRSSGFVPVPVVPAAEPVEPPRPEPMPEPEMDGPPSRPRRALPALEEEPDEPYGSDESSQDTARQPAVRVDRERPRAARAAAPPPEPAPGPPPVPTPSRRTAPPQLSTPSPDEPVRPPRRPARALIAPEPFDDDDIPEEPATVPVPRRSRAWIEPDPAPATTARTGPPGSPPSPERPPRRSAPPPSGPTPPAGWSAPAGSSAPPTATPRPAPAPPPVASRPPAAAPSPTRNPPPASGPSTRTGSTAHTGPPAPVRPYAPIPTTPPPTRPRTSSPAPSVAPPVMPSTSTAAPRSPAGPPPRRPSPSPAPAPRPAEPTSAPIPRADPRRTAMPPTATAPRPTSPSTGAAPPAGPPRSTSPSGPPAGRPSPAARPGPTTRLDPNPRPTPTTRPERTAHRDQTTRPSPTVRAEPPTRRGSTARSGPAVPERPAFDRLPAGREPAGGHQPRPLEQRRAAGEPDRRVGHRVPPIVVDRLVKAYNGVMAVRNLSFTVEPGRITGFLGPNGAGKTTTLRILVGLVSPTTGSATFGGTAYADLNRPQETVGAVLDANFHPGRTGRNHLRVLAATAGVTDRRVDQLLERVGLTAEARRPTGQYSLGMRQRLAIAAALIGNPDYLILDEPANGLDPEGIRWLRQMLRDFAATGRAVLVSSHLLNEVQATVDEIVVIHKGRLLAQMPMSDLHLGQGTIRARVSDLDTAGQVLEPLGVQVEWSVDDQGPYLRVHSQEVAAVGAALFNAGIVVHELVTERRDLEQEFFAMLEASR